MRTVAVVVAGALLAVVPLVADPSGWYVYLPLRWTVMVVGAGVLAALLAVAARRRVDGPGPSHPGPGPVLGRGLGGWTRAWVCLVVVAVVAALVSSGPRVALLGAADRMSGASTWILHGALALLGAHLVRRREDLVVLARGTSLGLLAVGCVTLAQRGGWDLPAGASQFARPGGPLGNANFLGAYGVLTILVAVGLVLDRDERMRWRLVAGLAAVVGAASVVASGSRGAWLAAAIGAAALLFLTVRRGLLSGRAALAGAGAALVVCLGLGAGAGAGQRFERLSGGTTQGRVDTWALTVDAIGQRPVLGWGPEGVAEAFTGVTDARFEQQYGRRLTPDRAHNGLLDVTATLGLVGLAVYLMVLAATGRRVIAAVRSRGPMEEPTRHATVPLAVAVALGAYLLQQQVLFPLADVDGLAWLLAGALVGLGAAARGPATDHTAARTPTETPATRLRSPATVVAGTVLVALLLASGVSHVVADRRARDAADALGTGGATTEAVTAARAALAQEPGQVLYGLLLADAAAATGDRRTIEDVLGALDRQRASTFDDGRLTLAEARLRGQIGDAEGATRLLDGLLRHDPARSEAWSMRGELSASSGDDRAAVRSWQRAADLRPREVEPRVRLLGALVRLGDVTSARTVLDQLDRLEVPAGTELAMDLMVWRARVEAQEAGTSDAGAPEDSRPAD